MHSNDDRTALDAVVSWDRMSSHNDDLGLGLLLLPIGLLVILGFVAALFMFAHDTPDTSTARQPVAQHQALAKS